jgi:3-hydroxyisobutyrate dehydrogenase-like beta-hydroxyacid dehydrogenase
LKEEHMNATDRTSTETPTASVIGLGTIGGAVARNLVAAGIPTAVYDLRAEARQPLAELGATDASSIAEAAEGASVVIVAVLNDEQVIDVLTGEGGVLGVAHRGQIVVIHSTVRLSTIRDLAERAAALGVQLLDAGVSTGGHDEKGRLALFVGGDDETVARAHPVIDAYTHYFEHLGPLGTGMVAKLIRNLFGYYMMAAAFETLRLAEATGVDLAALRRIFEGSNVTDQANFVLSYPTAKPVTESGESMEFGKLLMGLGAEELIAVQENGAVIVEKDLLNAVALATEAGVDLHLAETARSLVRPFLLLPPSDADPA